MTVNRNTKNKLAFFLTENRNDEDFSMHTDDNAPQDIVKVTNTMIECKPTKQDAFKGINTMIVVKPSVTLEEKNKDYSSNEFTNQKTLTVMVDESQHDGENRNEGSVIKKMQRDEDKNINNNININAPKKFL